MQRRWAVFGTALFLAIVPSTAAGLIPWWISGWRMAEGGPWRLPFSVSGALLITAGAAVILDSFARFALEGLGTPAPVAPPARLVTSGLYRYVRNPMYIAVVSCIGGQALLFGSRALAVYALLAWLSCHAFVMLYEEKKLAVTFGAEYERFQAAVPRWIPRLRPWKG